MLANEWSTINESTTTESILAQALPPKLAAPQGWRSEVLGSSSPTPSDTGNDFINSSSSFFEKHEEYKTLSTSDAPPIIFSSTNEVNRLINEIPSTTVNNSGVNEYNNTIIDESLSQEQRKFLLKDRRNLTINSDDQEGPPIILRKTLPNNTVTYQQNVSVRYLQPPTPPPPGPIIIREVRPPPPAPPSPVQIRQRPPPPETPPPIVIREKPPPPPPRLPSQVVEKCLPPPPRPPRRMIVERFASCPPKPPDVVIERWLPYKRTDRRRILFERAPGYYIPPQEPNLLILHDQPRARVQKEFINQGVTRADPLSYIQRYGSEIDSWRTNSAYAHLIDEATRTLPPGHSLAATGDYHDYYGSSSSRYPSSPVPLISNVWNRMRSASPPPYPSSYHNDTFYRHSTASPAPYSSSYHNDTSYRYSTASPYHYDGYGTSRGDFRTMVDVTPSWNQNCQSGLPSYQFSPSYPPRSIQVNSDGELDHVLSDLTRDRVSSSARFY